jgi:ABC-2 type transport system permease protein
MKSIGVALWCEFLKTIRSKILWISMIVFAIIPIIGGFFMIILKDPEFVHQSGMLGSKAQLAGIADWPSYFQFLAQAVSVGGLLLFGFITSWAFGREYSNRTLKDLLALPISRLHIVWAKFFLVFLWCIMLSLLVLGLGFAVGEIITLPGWSFNTISQGINMFLICAVLTMLLNTPVALLAGIGRGYLSPLGFVVLALVFAQIIGVAGYGQYFPWAIPAVYSRITGSLNAPLKTISYILVILTSALGITGTLLWWRYADHT